MSNFPAIPKRFRVIDETNWNEYHYIMPGDDCMYIWERMSKVKKGEYSLYPANQLIANLQIPMSCKTENPWRFNHKLAAVKYAARALGELLGSVGNLGTWVPIPPSSAKDDPIYDPRLHAVLKSVRPPIPDIRELVLLRESGDAKQKGLSPAQRAGDYFVDDDVAQPEPESIVLFDDVLTTGSHFAAIKLVLEERFPAALIHGLFLTRAVRPPDDEEASFGGVL